MTRIRTTVFVKALIGTACVGLIKLDATPARRNRPWLVEAQGDNALRWGRTLNEARRILSEVAPQGAKQKTVAYLGKAGRKTLARRRAA